MPTLWAYRDDTFSFAFHARCDKGCKVQAGPAVQLHLICSIKSVSSTAVSPNRSALIDERNNSAKLYPRCFRIKVVLNVTRGQARLFDLYEVPCVFSIAVLYKQRTLSKDVVRLAGLTYLR